MELMGVEEQADFYIFVKQRYFPSKEKQNKTDIDICVLTKVDLKPNFYFRDPSSEAETRDTGPKW